jgi:hypothetical protein
VREGAVPRPSVLTGCLSAYAALTASRRGRSCFTCGPRFRLRRRVSSSIGISGGETGAARLQASPYFTARCSRYGAPHYAEPVPGRRRLPVIVMFGWRPLPDGPAVVHIERVRRLRLALYVNTGRTGRCGDEPRAARLAAFLAGAVFAFSSYRFVHLGASRPPSTECLPFFALFLDQDTPRAWMAQPAWCGGSCSPR